MGIFGNNKKNSGEKMFLEMRRKAIKELRSQVANSNGLIEFNAEVEGSVQNFIETRSIEKLVELRISDMETFGKPSIKGSPLVEAVVNFIYTDMKLLDAQGDKDHTFQDSVDNMVFVIY